MASLARHEGVRPAADAVPSVPPSGAFFDHEGAFRYGRASDPGTGNLELALV
ncbi:hypothetical protein ABIA32_006558 [Streptacidiphilus sp. MAP12-20]|uniref:hypothetical protein n=1 Tax=Streptacidiphilus sp. MAP12-20 TaxID=3156299 RepID=UPI003517053A